MDLHTCLWNDVQAFHFDDEDFAILRQAIPDLEVTIHQDESSFLDSAGTTELVMAWEFSASWYQHLPNLKCVITPAAGKDWIEPDPHGKTRIIHGAFHGDLLAESLLSALLLMNHRMPVMWHNFQRRDWNRDLQKDSRLLRDQTVLIIGYGNIGEACGQMVSRTGARVIGISQSGRGRPGSTIPVHPSDKLDDLLPLADHVVLLLPGTSETDGLLSEKKIRQCKPGVYLYNFGRGNALRTHDLVNAWDHVGGAFLDVTEEEPLPEQSPLWGLEGIMITPHSSCIYASYKQQFLEEAIGHLHNLTAA